MVLLSTNKKEEGKDFTLIGKGVYLTSDTTGIDTINGSLMIMSTPIMGFNSRFGTVIITYSAQSSVIK